MTLYTEFLASSGVCTDTRKITADCIFFALKGDNFNGNRFAEKAIEQGARIAVIDEPAFEIPGKTVLVDDVLTSLQQLGRFHREKLSLPVIGLTGSNGKTTTKELIYSVLSETLNVFATDGNLNNHIGVPLSLLSITSEHDLAIIEMGANHQKEIEFLCTLSRPDYGVITNIGRAHLEGFGGYEGVIKGKTELFEFIRSTEGSIFYHADDSLITSHLPHLETIGYGTDQEVSGTITANTSLLEIELSIDETSTLVQTQLVGDYNLPNILCAAAIGNYFNLNLEQIKAGLEKFEPDNNRSQFIKTANNQLILDAYNANPSSMKAALQNFSKRPDTNKLAILGDMLELGEESKAEHTSLFELVESLTIKAFYVGKEFSAANPGTAQCFEQTADLRAHLEANPPQNATILIKGSRGIKLEPLAEVL